MDEQPALGTILFHVALLTIIVILVDERLIRAALAIIPAMLLAQRAIGATQAKSTDDWTGVDDRRMDVHVREHVTKLPDVEAGPSHATLASTPAGPEFTVT